MPALLRPMYSRSEKQHEKHCQVVTPQTIPVLTTHIWLRQNENAFARNNRQNKVSAGCQNEGILIHSNQATDHPEGKTRHPERLVLLPCHAAASTTKYQAIHKTLARSQHWVRSRTVLLARLFIIREVVIFTMGRACPTESTSGYIVHSNRPRWVGDCFGEVPCFCPGCGEETVDKHKATICEMWRLCTVSSR